MKTIMVVMAVVLSMGLAACGGSGGSSSPQDAINKSTSSFGDIMDSIMSNPGDCTPKAGLLCTCPGGGDADVDLDTYQAVFNSCKSADGLTYTGTIQTDAAGSTFTANMTTFGECSNVTGTITGGDVSNCSGSLSGTCAGESVTCTMSADCETCDI